MASGGASASAIPDDLREPRGKWAYHGKGGVEAVTVARRRARTRPGAVVRRDRSCGGGRQALVEDGIDDSLPAKIEDDVREVRRDEGMREEPRRGGAAHRGGRILKNDGGCIADSGEVIRRPGGVLGARVWGKSEWVERVLYGCNKGKQISENRLDLG